MEELDKELKSGELKNVYLFYGEEAYLIKQARQKIYDALIPKGSEAFNYSFFEGGSVSSSQISDACETLPFMNEKRLVYAKNTELFVQGRKDETESLADYIKSIPETSVLVFTEAKADKRNRLYKAVSKKGRCVELNKLKENDLIGFVAQRFKNEKIDNATALYFLRCVGSDMNSIIKETEKLSAYKNGEGTITKDDIDLICTKSLEAVIFDLVGAIGGKRADKALEIYNNLLIMKESPLMVLSMIARQFRMIIQCKYLAKNNAAPDEIGRAIGIRGFMARDYIRQSGNFTNKTLLEAIKDCLECDINIKTGKISDRLGVEMIIVKYASAADLSKRGNNF